MEKAFKIGDMVKYSTISPYNNSPPRLGIIIAIADNSSKLLHTFIYEVYWILDQITSTYFYSELSKV